MAAAFASWRSGVGISAKRLLTTNRYAGWVIVNNSDTFSCLCRISLYLYDTFCREQLNINCFEGFRFREGARRRSPTEFIV